METTSKSTRQKVQTIYILSRSRAKKSRLYAAWLLHMSGKTLERIENGHKIPDPEDVLDMELCYGDPELTERHCTEVCPIGMRRRPKYESKSLEGAALGLLKESEDLHYIKNRLIAIAADGVIDENERTDFEMILAEIEEIEVKIRALMLWALKNNLSPANKKSPVCVAAEPRMTYNTKSIF